VLITGGYTGASVPQSTVVLFDPATSSFTAAPPMAFARAEHTATRLVDGRVLVAGGDGSATTVEIYDPVANSWTTVASMGTGRREFTATLLADGRVLVVGGVSVATAQVYNPGTNTWSSTGALSSVRFLHAAALLPDGRVLVAGGTNGAGTTLATAEIYDPTTNAWSAASSMGAGRYIGTLTVLPDGQILAAGGVNGTSAEASTELFDSDTGTWSVGPSMVTGRFMHTATLLAGDRVLVTGGGVTSSTSLDAAEVYDVAIDTWTSARPMTGSRRLHTATALPDGRVLVVGGRTASGVTAEAELFSLKVEDIISFDPLPNRTFGDSTFAVTASAASGFTVGFTAAGNCSIAGDTVTITGAGSCTVTASTPGDLDYDPGHLARTFAIAKAPATLVLGGLAQTYDGTPRIVTVTTSPPGLATVTVKYDGAPTPPTGAGSYAIVASLSNPDYQAPDAIGTLVVAPAGQTITFDPLPARTYGDSPFGVTATASSGLPVGFAAAGSCSVAGTTVTLTGAGSCTVTASQGGDANYEAAPVVARPFAIAKSPTTTAVASLTNPSNFGQGVTFKASVTTSTFAGTPSGSVTFLDGSTVLGTQPLTGGQASLSTGSLAVGPHAITAQYLGDGDRLGSTSTVLTQTVLTTGADLVTTKVGDPPPTATPGEKFTVGDTVLNQGQLATGATTTTYYLSLDRIKSGNDRALDGTRIVGQLSPGATSSGTAGVVVPANVPLGTYYLLACANDPSTISESNPDNNCAASGTTIQLVPSPGPADLITAEVTVPSGITVTWGMSFEVTDRVNNIGIGVAAKPSITKYYLSRDGVERRKLDGQRSVDPLGPSQVSIGTASVRVQQGTPPGLYYIIACADDTQNVGESDETNNCRRSDNRMVQVTGR
jgi:hypothetical protein